MRTLRSSASRAGGLPRRPKALLRPVTGLGPVTGLDSVSQTHGEALVLLAVSKSEEGIPKI